MTPDSALYVHVPFCVRKCAYCDFYSEPVGPQAQREQAYLDTLRTELAGLPETFEPQTVYFGGGTPSALTAQGLHRLLTGVLARAPRAGEITCEVNPGTLTEEKAEMLRASGVNRVSLGAQSLDDRVLAFLGRIHRKGEIAGACRLLRDAGMDNISLDLMYGLPAEVSRGPEEDLEQLLELRPEHLSCYALSYEPGTPLHCDLQAGRFQALEDDICRAQYDAIRARLKTAGFVHYELSNFARPGRISRHNTVYWTGGDYIGIGPAAHSFWQGRRYANPCDLAAWQVRVQQEETKAAHEKTSDGADALRGSSKCHYLRADPEVCLAPLASAREQVVLGLRMLEGISLAMLEQRTGFSLDALYPDGEVERLVEVGMLTLEHGRIRLTEEALFISNAVFSELI